MPWPLAGKAPNVHNRCLSLRCPHPNPCIFFGLRNTVLGRRYTFFSPSPRSPSDGKASLPSERAVLGDAVAAAAPALRAVSSSDAPSRVRAALLPCSALVGRSDNSRPCRQECDELTDGDTALGREGGRERWRERRIKLWWRSPRDSPLSPSRVPDSNGAPWFAIL